MDCENLNSCDSSAEDCIEGLSSKENVLAIEHLTKSYGDVKAVDDVGFSVERGSLFAFLGINGAGKSTTINIICQTLSKDGGKVTVDGLDIDKDSEEAKKKIGIVFQNSVLDDKLTVKDNLKIRASYYGLRGKEMRDRLDELKELFELGGFWSRPFGKLSGGQRRRVDIARALLHEPKILMLDEPTTGLDPKTRKAVWSIIDGLQKNTGMTVFLTTHYMEEADNADNVVIIDGGKIVASGKPNELKNEFSGDYLKIYSEENISLFDALKAFAPSVVYRGGCYVVRLKDNAEAKRILINLSDMIYDFEVIKGNMDDVFLNATGKSLEEESNA